MVEPKVTSIKVIPKTWTDFRKLALDIEIDTWRIMDYAMKEAMKKDKKELKKLLS